MMQDCIQSPLKAIIVPGNGGDRPTDRWLPYVTAELGKFGILVTNVEFPDPVIARQEYWLPFLKKLGADENTILIGHSSGAIAAMRYAETNEIYGTVLVGSYHTDLGMESEKESGYFDLPWDWRAIQENQKWIIQFASTDDPFIPIEEARYIRDHLNTEYHEFTDRGHFGSDQKEFPELVEAVKEKIK